MTKYNDLKPTHLNDIMHNRVIFDVVTTRHMPRQVMALDDKDNPVFNYEYPAYPFSHGLYSGPEQYARDILVAVKQSISEGKTIAELYFLGTRLEYEKLADVMRNYKEKDGAEQPLACFYVKPDIESIRTDISLAGSKKILDEMRAIVGDPIEPEDEDSESESASSAEDEDIQVEE